VQIEIPAMSCRPNLAHAASWVLRTAEAWLQLAFLCRSSLERDSQGVEKSHIVV
jgi:hypothetical protein